MAVYKPNTFVRDIEEKATMVQRAIAEGLYTQQRKQVSLLREASGINNWTNTEVFIYIKRQSKYMPSYLRQVKGVYYSNDIEHGAFIPPADKSIEIGVFASSKNEEEFTTWPATITSQNIMKQSRKINKSLKNYL